MNETIAKLTTELCSYLRTSITEKPNAWITTRRPGMALSDIFWPRINVYLMEVNENPSLRNQFVPSAGNGQVFPVGLDLRYLFTFYGRGTLPQDLLQTALKAMSARPVFDPTGGKTPASAVRLSLEGTDITTLEKIWSMMGVRHAPSLIYRATGLIV